MDKLLGFFVLLARMPFTVADARDHIRELRQEVREIRDHQIRINTIVDGCPVCSRQVAVIH